MLAWFLVVCWRYISIWWITCATQLQLSGFEASALSYFWQGTHDTAHIDWSMHVGRTVLTHWGGKRKITAKQGHRQHCNVTCADEWTPYTSLFVYFFLTLMLLSPSQLGINRTWQVVNKMHFHTIPPFSYAIIPHSHWAGIVRCFLLMTMD